MKAQILPIRNRLEMVRKISETRKERLRSVGLHYCLHYKNVVRYNEPSCGKCPYCTYPKR